MDERGVQFPLAAPKNSQLVSVGNFFAHHSLGEDGQCATLQYQKNGSCPHCFRLDRCCELVADFSKKFNLNLGLAPNLLPQPQAVPVAVKVRQDEQDQLPAPRCPRCNVEMRRYASKFKPNTYWLGCPNFRVNGCLEKLPA